MLSAAINAGADAVYFGVQQLNMRITAANFKISDLKSVCKKCHENKGRKIKAYLTLNTIIYNNELSEVTASLKKAKAAGIDAVICWDPAVILECKKQKIPIHISTQASISNAASAKFYHELGTERIVLARECRLTDITEIKKKVPGLGIEVFAHGAMCVSVSGRCFTSQFLFGKSANRGDCLQPCRREYETYRITDEENNELILGNKFVMSAKDLCTIDILDKLMDAGADALKIEGRNKSAEYVSVVTAAYRKAIDACMNGNLDDKLKAELKSELQKVFNRGFSTGFYMGVPINEFTDVYGSKSTEIKIHVGIVKNYYKKVSAAEILIEDNSLKTGDEVFIIGPTTGCVRQQIKSMQIEHKEAGMVKKGQRVAVKVEGVVRVNDKVYLIKNR